MLKRFIKIVSYLQTYLEFISYIALVDHPLFPFYLLKGQHSNRQKCFSFLPVINEREILLCVVADSILPDNCCCIYNMWVCFRIDWSRLLFSPYLDVKTKIDSLRFHQTTRRTPFMQILNFLQN